jgi:membrane protein implicated in regulation of membrane protease activity
MEWFWLSLAIALTVIELSTVQLVSIWFAAGAAVTAIIKGIFPQLGISWQIILFVAVSVALFASTRRFVKKFLSSRKEEQKTNLDLIIGKEAIVVEEINNIRGEGAVKIDGKVWSARSSDGSDIPVDTIVIFKEINGNKAMVERKGE